MSGGPKKTARAGHKTSEDWNFAGNLWKTKIFKVDTTQSQGKYKIAQDDYGEWV